MKPTVKLIGQDGNAFGILGECLKSAKRAGWSKDQIDAFKTEAMSGDYENVIATACKYFEVS